MDGYQAIPFCIACSVEGEKLLSDCQVKIQSERGFLCEISFDGKCKAEIPESCYCLKIAS
jgi:hypothetical protein